LEEFNRVSVMAITVIPPSEPGGKWQSVFDRRKEIFPEAREAARLTIRAKLGMDDAPIRNLPPDKLDAIQLEFGKLTDAEVEKRLATDPEAKPWLELRDAYRAKDPMRFNLRLYKMAGPPENVDPKALSMLKRETFFNHFAPFYQCIGLYVATCVLSL